MAQSMDTNIQNHTQNCVQMGQFVKSVIYLGQRRHQSVRLDSLERIQNVIRPQPHQHHGASQVIWVNIQIAICPQQLQLHDANQAT